MTAIEKYVISETSMKNACYDPIEWKFEEIDKTIDS